MTRFLTIPHFVVSDLVLQRFFNTSYVTASHLYIDLTLRARHM
jgi:hypothetical protein